MGKERNPYHVPAGSSKGGQFTTGTGQEQSVAEYDKITKAARKAAGLTSRPLNTWDRYTAKEVAEFLNDPAYSTASFVSSFDPGNEAKLRFFAYSRNGELIVENSLGKRTNIYPYRNWHLAGFN